MLESHIEYENSITICLQVIYNRFLIIILNKYQNLFI